MRVIVCGPRDAKSPAKVWVHLEKIHKETPITELMHGGARGTDRFAKEWATSEPSIVVYVCKADWLRHGPAAGPIRNSRMLEWKPDRVIAFDGYRAERAGPMT